jgi:hypothetical protein
MPPRRVAAVVMAAAAMVEVVMAAAAMVEVVTEVAGIFTGVAISAVTAADISAVGISEAAGVTSAVDRRDSIRLRDRVFAAIVLSLSITPDRLRCGR